MAKENVLKVKAYLNYLEVRIENKNILDFKVFDEKKDISVIVF